jgi:hypothetical protein
MVDDNPSPGYGIPNSKAVLIWWRELYSAQCHILASAPKAGVLKLDFFWYFFRKETHQKNVIGMFTFLGGQHFSKMISWPPNFLGNLQGLFLLNSDGSRR